MRVFLTKLWHSKEATTAVEYGLLSALIAVIAVTAYQTVGTNVSSTFRMIATSL